MNVSRQNSFMKKLKSHNKPKRLLFLDTETHIIEGDNNTIEFPLKLGVCSYVELDKEYNIKKKEIYKFKTIGEYVDILKDKLSKRSKLYIFAHNVGFDVRVLELHTQFATLGWENEPPIINNRVFIWEIKSELGNCVFMDTANYGVMSVDDIGSGLGYDKLKVDFDTVTEDELFTYCIRDVEILEKFILNLITFLEQNNLGAFKSTLASQSLAVFRTRFMNNPPYIHTNPLVLSLERDGYKGGRVECFFIGELPRKDYYYVDVNSMYPFAMSSNRLPLKLYSYRENIQPEYLLGWIEKYYTIADVTIKTKENAFAYRQRNKLIFPIGEFRTVLHDSEIQYAIENSEIIHIHKIAGYEYGSIFEDYVNFFYEHKKQYTLEGNKPYRTIAKLFQNSLYGKFGQLKPHRKIIYEGKDDKVWREPYTNLMTGKTSDRIYWFGTLFEEYKEGETLQSCPAIAGAITAIARMRLHEFINIAGKENTFYCDTDSLIVNSKGFSNLSPYMDDYELGMLALEDESSIVTIHGNKDYEFGDTIRKKGVPASAKLIGENKFQYLQFQGFITWLNNGAMEQPTATYRVKERKQKYDKGIVNKKGDVSPHVLG